ncbi:MAG: hypothetical protein H6Q77_1630 [Gemmatimonadetes bacterium]|jgi:hypothetical protein|nr:hypothetical protein [Gemmatimonadota bacterium]
MTESPQEDEARATGGTSWFVLALAWIGVGVPMLWGVWMTLKKAALLFR